MPSRHPSQHFYENSSLAAQSHRWRPPGQRRLIASAARRAADADLAVTSELALLGYPPRDLLLNADFVERSWAVLRHLAQELADLSPLLVGLAEPNPG